MNNTFQFTFLNIESQLQLAIDQGYTFITCLDYYRSKDFLEPKSIVLRVDIDGSVKKADRLRIVFKKLGVKATFFVRLHAPEYNPFSFENYRILKALRDDGHEIGYHSEVIDQATIWNEDAADCLVRDIEILNRMLGIKVQGVASHGGLTGLNNLEFWNNRQSKDFNVLYEAYEDSNSFNLFNLSFYISDSEWTRWKCYNRGVLRDGDRRSFGEHLIDGHNLIYLLIHPDTYFDRHIYE